jgi:GTP-dependent phosphoenolpyruvate carboxykinase
MACRGESGPQSYVWASFPNDPGNQGLVMHFLCFRGWPCRCLSPDLEDLAEVGLYNNLLEAD